MPQGWWGPRKWLKLRAKLLAHDPWLIEMLEHHQGLLITQQRRIAQLDREIARESNYDGRKVAKGLGQTTFASLHGEAMDWKRFANRKQIGSYIGCCPSEFSTGTRQTLGSIDRLGNRRMRTLLVEAVWYLKTWNPTWRGFKKFLTSSVSTPPPGEPPEKKPWWLVLGCSPSICGGYKPSAPV